KEKDSGSCQRLASGLAHVASRLEPADAERVCDRGIMILLATRAETMNNGAGLVSLERAVAALLSPLARTSAHRIANQLASEICAARDCSSVYDSTSFRSPSLSIISSPPILVNRSDPLMDLLSDSSLPVVRRRSVGAAGLVGQATRSPLDYLHAL